MINSYELRPGFWHQLPPTFPFLFQWSIPIPISTYKKTWNTIPIAGWFVIADAAEYPSRIPRWFVIAMVCDRDSLWSRWFVIAASLWSRLFVSAMVCDRGGFGEFVSAVICDRCGLWPQWVCWISFSRVVLGVIASTLKWLWFTCVRTKSGNVCIPWWTCLFIFKRGRNGHECFG